MQLQYRFETTFTEPVETGAGVGLIVEGWAFCAQSPIRQLWMSVNGKKIPITERGNARQDILVAKQTGDSAGDKQALLSGFWVVLPIEPLPVERELALRIVAEVQSGETVVSGEYFVKVRPSTFPARETLLHHLHQPLPANPKICICMTTYNPGEEVFRRQIDSIRAQEYTNWVCLIQDDWSSHKGWTAIRNVIGDDPRFILEQNTINLGFYHNFEKVLTRVPPDCHLVCLADQDDRWFPTKLTKLMEKFTTPDTSMVYSDMRIVDGEGKVLSNTFWTTRKNNYTDLETMFFANTVTGAAVMMKAALLPLLLPFPPKRGLMYHDWWIALVAMTAGRIQYVEEPLYDYYQHGGNVVGWSHIGRIVSFREFLRSDVYRRELAHAARTMYNNDGKFLSATIETLRLRVAEPVSPKIGAALARLSRLKDRPVATMVGQCLRAATLKRASQNREKNIFMAHAVMRLLNRYFARKRHEILAKFSSDDEARSSEPGAPRQQVMPVDTFARKSEPLNLDVRENEPMRVNMFLATIDFRYFFGGYIGMFQLAKHIAEAGFKVRFILLEPTEVQPNLWRQSIRKYKGLENIFDLVEVEYRFDRSIPTPVCPDDRFISTSCWSSWVADAAARELGDKPFVFMIQEYEPYFVPHGSYYALSHAAYDLNLYGLFSTEILREFFRQKQFGIYRNGRAEGDARSLSFNNAVLKFNVDRERLQERKGRRKKLLYYCRPEAHAQRNMFELGVLALRQAINDGALDPATWDFYGIGTVGEQFSIPLPKGARMVALPKMSLEEYAEYLPDFDLGMSLMYTPHPSLVPLEMAGAGLVSVTNSCENKTAAVLRDISTNFEVGDANVQDLAAALKRAEKRVDDIDARIQGAAIHWPTSWDEAFSPQVIAPLLAELRRGQRARQLQAS